MLVNTVEFMILAVWYCAMFVKNGFAMAEEILLGPT